MSYNPRTYWRDRMITQGPDYVGPFGDKNRSEKQATDFRQAIRETLEPCSHILDYGCGTGRLTNATTIATEYTGVDLNNLAIDHANGLFEHDETRNFIHLDDHRIPAASGTFDAVLLVTVAQHIPHGEWEKAAAEIRRVTTDNAQVLVIDHWETTDAPHMFGRTPCELSGELDFDLDVDDLRCFGEEDHNHLFLYGRR